MHIITSPSLPYWGHIPEGGLQPGSVIQITGHIPHHCSKFELNLFGGHEFGHHAEHHSNIALQIRSKLHKRKVIVNSRHNGHWGHKEKHKDFHHFYHGSSFDVMIVVEHQHYHVMVNGHTVCHFHHRVPLHEVRILNVEGHVDVHRIEFKHNHHSHTAVYPSAPPGVYYPPSHGAPVHQYPTHGAPAYPSAYPPVYPPAQPVYIAPVATPYAPSTVVIEDHHHHHNRGGGLIGGLIDTFSGHHGPHHGHHYDHHHDHHKHHGHHKHH